MRIRSVPALIALSQLATASPALACIERTPTPHAWLGPHDFSSAPAERELWRKGDPGEPLVLTLRVLDTCGEPVPGARVHLLHADQDGEHRPGRYRALLDADARGTVDLITVYPGYAGDLARHVHFIVTHPGYRDLVTRLYFKNDPAAQGGDADALAMVVEEVRRGDETRWVGGYEFVLEKAP